MKKGILTEIAGCITNFDIQNIRKLVRKAVKLGLSPLEIITRGMAKGMDTVGRLYEKGEYFLPELVMAGNAMRAGMEVLEPYFKTREKAEFAGKVIIGTVQGDLHDLGKNLVTTMLTSAGFKIYDLGTDVPPEKFVRETRKVQPDIVAMSALLLATMPVMKEVVDALKEAGLRDEIKIMVGGRPVTQEYADEIGADGYAKDAIEAVQKAKELLKNNSDLESLDLVKR